MLYAVVEALIVAELVYSANLKVTPFSEIEQEEEVVVSIHGRQDNVQITQPVEPKSY